MSLFSLPQAENHRKLVIGVVIFAFIGLIALGAMAKNGWLPKTDPITGKRTGWFGKPIEARNNTASVPLNPTPTPQLAREYLYAGSRLLTVEDADANALNIEADTSPRELGDGRVRSDDVIQIRLFLIGSDTPNSTTNNEFQRADVSPRHDADNLRGDGFIRSDDVVQARRYQIGSDPPTPADGPMQPPGGRAVAPADGKADAAKKNDQTREVETASVLAVINPVLVSRVGNRLTLGIELNTGGAGSGVNALSFTLNYNPALLSHPSNCQPGNASRTGGEISILCNYGQPGAGFVGVVVDLDPNQTFSAGIQRVGLMDFTVAPGVEPTLAAFSFGDVPCPRSASDALANSLMPTFTVISTQVPIQ